MLSDVPLGSSGLTVSQVGFGLAAIGRPGYINLGRDDDLGEDRSVEAMEARAHALLDEAWDLGVRYFDAARSYGRAESFVASWLAQHQPLDEPVLVGSKWGYTYIAGWRTDADVHEIKDHSLEALQRQVAESRDVLGDQLGLYQIHSATLESGVLEDEALLAVLVNLSHGGLPIGLTTSGPNQADTIRRALEIEVDGLPLFCSVQATWNLLEPSVAEALAEAHDEGLGVIIKEPLANGRLSRGDAPGTLADVAGEHQVGVDQVAIAAALERPWVDTVLSGAVTTDQLQSNVAAVDLVLTDDDYDSLASIVELPADYWATRAALPWS